MKCRKPVPEWRQRRARFDRLGFKRAHECGIEIKRQAVIGLFEPPVCECEPTLVVEIGTCVFIGNLKQLDRMGHVGGFDRVFQLTLDAQ